MVSQEIQFLSVSSPSFHKPNITQTYRLLFLFTVITVGLLLEFLMLRTMYKITGSDLTFLKDDHLNDHLYDSADLAIQMQQMGTTEERITEEHGFVMAAFLRAAFHSHRNSSDFLEKL